jgi:steroid delta-isomerase
MNSKQRWQHRCNLLAVPSADDYTQTVNRYIDLVGGKGGADELTALYAEDATIEDPIGSDVRSGRVAVHEFYAAIENLSRESELISLRVTGNEAAFLWRLTLTTGDNRTRIEPISVMTFGDDAKITSMRAFWSPADLKVL